MPFNPNQPRDDHGRWSEGGGGLGAGRSFAGYLKGRGYLSAKPGHSVQRAFASGFGPRSTVEHGLSRPVGQILGKKSGSQLPYGAGRGVSEAAMNKAIIDFADRKYGTARSQLRSEQRKAARLDKLMAEEFKKDHGFYPG